ncbi:MAG: hypothetical protein LBQ98_10170 [Nitrososphaerota archaeon]|jgi:hypothetical protein|nr:hypothetical protein [Nitrososphaerota archaeon]
MSEMKRVSLLLVVLILSCGFLSILDTVQAESTAPKPAVPEFTVKLVDRSYDVAPTQTTNPYTGKTETKPGYHVEQIDIDITIKNQNYPYTLMYHIRTKGYFEENWKPWSINNNADFYQSDGQYTVVTIPYYSYIYDWQDGAKVDFQVEALYGSMEWNDDNYVPGVGGSWHFVGVKSGWSKTQTLTITYSNGILDQPPNNSETDPNSNQWTGSIWTTLSIISVIVVVVVVVSVILLKLGKNSQHEKQHQSEV